MGDCKLSQFLRHLRSFAPDVLDDFLCSIWSGWLKPNIWAILAGQPEGDLDATACISRHLRELHHFLTSAFLQQIEALSRQVALLSAYKSKS
jgi:hypothetical protein